MSGEQSTPEPVSRRALVRGIAVGGLSLPLLAACGAGSNSAGPPAGGPTATPTPKHSRSAATGSKPGRPPLTTTSKVPVGGGEIIGNAQVVVTQPSKDEFKAFSSICTHQGCPVSEIQNGAILCPCHGSAFSIKDGSVLGGPAPAPLPEYRITVKGTQIRRA